MHTIEVTNKYGARIMLEFFEQKLAQQSDDLEKTKSEIKKMQEFLESSAEEGDALTDGIPLLGDRELVAKSRKEKKFISFEEFSEIKNLLESGIPQNKIAERFDTSKSIVSRINLGKFIPKEKAIQ